MLKHKKICIVALLLAAALPITQSASATLPLGALLHHGPMMGHGLGLHPFAGIPRAPGSENSGTPFINSLKTMHNLYKVDNTIVDASPGILGIAALSHQQKQAQANSTYSSNTSEGQ